jgi:hypothetical protein
MAPHSSLMSRDDAEQRAARLNHEHPERGAYRWLAREAPEGWEVVRMTVPGGVRTDPLAGAVESRPRPDAPDPRTTYERNVGGPYAN